MSPRPLGATTWVLDTIVTGDVAAPVPDGVRPPTLQIDGERVSIDAGCNTGSATVAISDGEVTFGPGATTRRMCDEASMLVEHAALDVVSGHHLGRRGHGSTLTLTTGTASLVFHAA